MVEQHTIVVDLGFGDAGKGTVVDYLCATASTRRRPVAAVVRFNGGAQAGHNVVTDDGRHHRFAQFGSGAFTPPTATHLSRHALVDPLALAAEADHLESVGVPDPFARLTVHRDAVLTTPYHAAANRARESARGAGRHGSCGMGVGETTAYALAHGADAPRAADCLAPARLRRRLNALHERLAEELGPLPVPPVDDCVSAFHAVGRAVCLVDDDDVQDLLHRGPVVFEGAQGVLLDEWHGFHPHTTWSTTTPANAEELLAEAGLPGEALRIGVVRTYTTRHGVGPLVTEDAQLTAAVPDAHNGTGPWQGAFRLGHFDAVAHRYAVDVAGGVDAVALTHLDVAARHRLAACRRYAVDGETVGRLVPGPAGDLERQARLTAQLSRAEPVLEPVPDAADWPHLVEEVVCAPVTLTSHGPRLRDKQERGPAARPPASRSPADRPAAAQQPASSVSAASRPSPRDGTGPTRTRPTWWAV